MQKLKVLKWAGEPKVKGNFATQRIGLRLSWAHPGEVSGVLLCEGVSGRWLRHRNLRPRWLATPRLNPLTRAPEMRSDVDGRAVSKSGITIEHRQIR